MRLKARERAKRAWSKLSWTELRNPLLEEVEGLVLEDESEFGCLEIFVNLEFDEWANTEV